MTQEIKISLNSDGELETNIAAVPVLADGVVSFTAPRETAISLCLTERTAGILSPRPPSLTVGLAAASTVSFVMTAAAPGDYVVVVQMPDLAYPAGIDEKQHGEAPVLRIQAASTGFESGPGDDIRQTSATAF
jgi:hypothetical protein